MKSLLITGLTAITSGQLRIDEQGAAQADHTVRGPEDIDRVGVLLGEPGGDYRTHARPRSITLMTGGHRPVVLSFDDAPAFQKRAVSLRGLTSITVVIRSVYPSQKGQAVAMRELEFFLRV
ncbi:MAG: hypothetical protein ACM3ML_27500 [Micromonosporaceae bacterium]